MLNESLLGNKEDARSLNFFLDQVIIYWSMIVFLVMNHI